MGDLRWFRLEIDSVGKVLSCVAVERAEQRSSCWVYVQATDEAAAHRIGLNAYMRVVMRKRRERLKAEGKCCWCGRKNDREPGKRCTLCLGKDSEYGKRKNARVAGKPVAPLDRRVAIAERKREEQSQVVAAVAPSLRLAVLEEVQDAWCNTSTNGQFTAWLVKEIERAGGKRRAG